MVITVAYHYNKMTFVLNHLYLRPKYHTAFDKRNTAIRGHPKHGFFPVALETAEKEADLMSRHI